ncbi:hypothetical protein C8P70_11739 [Myroides indicus]|uniref:Uncharacterized protein n=2 Tax=Myroides indicus TaxID=1323422 RepID=A0A4R7ETT2_9FLAO|nr:hypothetical protein C8P70_11739 [Myroides indicus]
MLKINQIRCITHKKGVDKNNMSMNKKLLYILSVMLCISCKHKKEDTYNLDNQIVYDQDISVINFPDTVYKNLKIEGIIDYNFNEYNSLKNHIGRGSISRYIHFYPYVSKDKIVNEDDFIIKDTFYTQDINKILFDVRFDNVGVFYLNGIIKDMIIFDTISNMENSDSKLPAQFSYVLINKKVVVIDKE